MTPIEYISWVKKWFWTQFLVTTGGFLGIIFALNPRDNELYLSALLIDLAILFCSILLLIALWYFAQYQTRILTISQINQLIYQSIISSCTIILVLVLVQTNNLNIISGAAVVLSYTLYQLWANSQDN